MHVFGTKYRLSHNKRFLGEDNQGLIDKDKKTIYVDNKLDQEEYMTTLIHELGHAIYHELGLFQVIEKGIEEISVDAIGKVLVKNFDIRFKSDKRKK